MRPGVAKWKSIPSGSVLVVQLRFDSEGTDTSKPAFKVISDFFEMYYIKHFHVILIIFMLF